MKSILFTALVGVMALAACSDEVRVQLDIVDADNYSRIYMSQANNTPNMQGIFITSDVQYLPVTAFYGGPLKAEKILGLNLRYVLIWLMNTIIIMVLIMSQCPMAVILLWSQNQLLSQGSQLVNPLMLKF